MALKTVEIRWGKSFENTLNLHDDVNYLCLTNDLWGGPEWDVQTITSSQGVPTYTGSNLQERVFSLTVDVAPYDDVWDVNYNAALKALQRACNRPADELVRVVIEREGIGKLYVEARCEQVKETKDLGAYEVLFKAPNPVFTRLDDTLPNNVITQPGSGAYLPLNVPSYPGSAPSQPRLELKATSASQLWHYYKNITIVNPYTVSLRNYPICISLGDVTALITAGKMRSDLGDIRLESPGGARKPIYVRDNGGTHTDVKVWFIMNQLLPTETKVLRLLYGNPVATADTEQAGTRPMFNMYTSTNSVWKYINFAPAAGLNQSRAFQWQRYNAPTVNLAAINFIHPHFDAPSENAIPCAGGYVPAFGPAQGYAGLMLTTPLPMLSAAFTYRTRTAAYKTPFAMFSKLETGSWLRQFTDRTDTGQRATITINATGAATLLWISSISGLVVGDTIQIQNNAGTYDSRTILTLGTNPTNGPFVTVAAISGTGAAVGNEVTKYPTGNLFGTVTQTWTVNNYPNAILFCLVGERPDLNSGFWYYGAAETADITFLSTAIPTVTLGSEQTIVHHVSGTLQSDVTGESIGLNTILNAIGDRIILDCEERTCKYYPAPVTTLTANGVKGDTVVTVASVSGISVGDTIGIVLDSWEILEAKVLVVNTGPKTLQISPPLPSPAASGAGVITHIEDRFDGIVFPTDVNYYWVHLEPSDAGQNIIFSGGNLYNLQIRILWPAKYY